MKVRWTSLGVAIGLALALTMGFAFASDPSTLDPTGRDRIDAVTQTDGWPAMGAMHVSPAMQRLHAQMPEELQAQCEAMHEQMEQMMDAGSGSPGGMMGPGSGSMMGPGSGSMMGPGSGSMMGS